MAPLFAKKYNVLHSKYTRLLFFLILIFIFRPYNSSDLYTGAWHLLLVGALCYAFRRKIVRNPLTGTVVVISGIISIISFWTASFFDHHLFAIIFLITFLIFLITCVMMTLSVIFFKSAITGKRLSEVICAYFLIGFSFGLIFMIIEVSNRGSFNLTHIGSQCLLIHSYYIADLFYYSFIMLATIGLGNDVARSGLAQAFTVLEGITGQLFVAIYVSKLVTIYSHQTFEDSKKQPKRK